MLRRILLGAAILLGLGVVALNLTMVQDKITKLKDDRDNWNRQFTQTDAALKKTTADLDATKQDLRQTKTQLANTQKERDDAVTKAAAEVKRADGLAEELAKTKKNLDDTRAELARYQNTGLTPEQILVLNNQIKAAQDALEVANTEKQVISRQLENTKIELLKFIKRDFHVPLPPKLRGEVVVTDPKWDFVVLNVGENQGMRKDGELLVNRDGKLVAKVRVTSVQKNRSIANIEPGQWKIGEVIEGDQVIPAYPQTSDTVLY